MSHEWQNILKWVSSASGIALVIGWFMLLGYGDILAEKYLIAKGQKVFVTQEVYKLDKIENTKTQLEISKDLKSILANLRSINATFAANKIKMINVEVN